MTKIKLIINQCLLIAIVTCLLLGQLTRINLSPTIACYFHDFLIIIYLLFNSRQIFKLIKNYGQQLKSSKKSRHDFIIIVLIGLFYLLCWTITHSITFNSLLYSLRFLTYLIFILVTYHQKIFTPKQWQNLLLIFLLAFASIGLGQYLIFPDTTFLENLGWDDHYHRLIGTWFDPAFVGVAFVWGLIYVSSIPTAKLIKKLKIILLSLLLIGLILTYSRASYLALLIVMIFRLFSKKELIYKLKSVIRKKNNYFKIITGGLLLILLIGGLYYLFPSDSTNLLRTNSITIRRSMLIQQCESLTMKEWLIGRGPFGTFSPSIDLTKLAPDYKITASFPDNFFLLLISFFGLPLASLLTFSLIKLFIWLKQKESIIFYYLLALLVNAQFNQSVFQPLIILTFGLFLLTNNDIIKNSK